MGRSAKTVLDQTGVDRRRYGYYSTPEFAARFLTEEMLRLSPEGLSVLDPCVGKEELAVHFVAAGKDVDGFDIHDFGVHEWANFRQIDFLDFYAMEKARCQPGKSASLAYDYYILNPPYNCHELEYIRKRKPQLQSLFANVGVANMYSMFLSAVIDLAKDGALIGAITLDSFLTAGVHKRLREQILSECSIHGIYLCPTSLFHSQRADVRTCVVILQKGKQHQGKVKTLNRLPDLPTFRQVLETRSFEQIELEELLLVSSHDSNEFVIGCPVEIKNLFENPRLGQLFTCVTGISTGDDAKYLSLTQTDLCSVPFYKNPGSRRFFMEPDAYLQNDFLSIERSVRNFMVRNKELLFQQGITCSSMGIPFGACYLPAGATFGVNANIICSEDDIWWLLAYLNSSLVTYFVRGILLRTNMITSGYVSRIPICPLSEKAKTALAELARNGYSAYGSRSEEVVASIDAVVFEETMLSDTSRSLIRSFCRNLLKST